jgi:hypothetical protein
LVLESILYISEKYGYKIEPLIRDNKKLVISENKSDQVCLKSSVAIAAAI